MKTYHKINSLYKRNEKTHKFNNKFSCEEFELLQDCQWSFQEKIDGTNIRVYFDGEHVRFGGRTEKAQIPTSLFARLQDIFTLDKLKESFDYASLKKEIIFFGEGYGNKVQKVGKLYLKDSVDFILFDCLIGYNWQSKDNLESFAERLGIKYVPFVGQGTLSEAIELVKKGFDSKVGNCKAEGLVLRPLYELKDRVGNRIITKIKAVDFK